MNYYEKIIREKRNDNVVEKYSHNGAVIEIIKTDSGKFRSRISKKGKTEETMTVSGTRMEAMRDAEASADRLNSKEEKDNANFHYLGKTFSVTSGNFQQVRQQVQKAYWDKVKELEVKLRSAQGAEEQRIEKELREIREGYKETMEEFDRFNNSKEQSYYAKLAEEKKQKENFWYKEQTPEEAARILKALEPIVEQFKKQGMSPADIAMRLEKEKRVTPEVARQAVQAFY